MACRKKPRERETSGLLALYDAREPLSYVRHVASHVRHAAWGLKSLWAAHNEPHNEHYTTNAVQRTCCMTQAMPSEFRHAQHGTCLLAVKGIKHACLHNGNELGKSFCLGIYQSCY